MAPEGLGRELGFDRKGVQPLIYEILQRIIHKPVSCHCRLTRK